MLKTIFVFTFVKAFSPLSLFSSRFCNDPMHKTTYRALHLWNFCKNAKKKNRERTNIHKHTHTRESRFEIQLHTEMTIYRRAMWNLSSFFLCEISKDFFCCYETLLLLLFQFSLLIFLFTQHLLLLLFFTSRFRMSKLTISTWILGTLTLTLFPILFLFCFFGSVVMETRWNLR